MFYWKLYFSLVKLTHRTIFDRKGDYNAASKLHSESLLLFRELGERGMIAELLLDLGRATRRQGDYDEAQATLTESISISKELGHVDAIAVCLEELAACACMMEQFERATRLLGAVETLREAKRLPTSPAYRSDIQRDIAKAGSALGENVFNREWTRGRALTLEQTIAYALTGEPAD
jgi:tetratricopeptide (TPR) repeat protein